MAKLLLLESTVIDMFVFSAKGFQCPAISFMGKRGRHHDSFLILRSQGCIPQLSRPSGDFLYPHLKGGGRGP